MYKSYLNSSIDKLALTGLLFLLIGSVQAQIKIGDDGANIFPSSLLELQSDNKGLLIPRMANTTAIDALDPQEGMLIYITTPPAGLYVRKATTWEHLAGFTNGFANNVTGTVAVANGGTGQTTALAGFNALSPMRNAGDLIYGGVGGSALPLSIGSATQVLKGGATSPVWGSVVLNTDVGTSILPPVNGGTGIANTNTLTLSGANISLTATSNTNVTLPTTGTLATLAGSEALTNKTINGNIITASSGTLTLAAGSTLATAGANPITFTSTGPTTLTLPTIGTVATTSSTLNNFTNTTSAQLASVITDESGTGNLLFSNSPVLISPSLGTPSALIGTNITGTAPGLTAGNVITNANLTGAITSTGNTTLLGSFSSVALAGAVTGETGTGGVVFSNNPSLVRPVVSAVLGNPTFVPTIVASAGFVSAPSISGSDVAGTITFTVTGGVINSTLVTVTYNTAYGVDSYPVLFPGNDRAATGGAVFADGTNANFTIRSNSTGVLLDGIYIYNYQVVGNN